MENFYQGQMLRTVMDNVFCVTLWPSLLHLLWLSDLSKEFQISACVLFVAVHFSCRMTWNKPIKILLSYLHILNYKSENAHNRSKIQFLLIINNKTTDSEPGPAFHGVIVHSWEYHLNSHMSISLIYKW